MNGVGDALRNPLQGNQALARWNSSAFTWVVSERGRDELCSSSALTVKNGAVQWGVTTGSLLRRCLEPPEVVGASPAPEGKQTDGHACPSLFPAHTSSFCFSLCVSGPSWGHQTRVLWLPRFPCVSLSLPFHLSLPFFLRFLKRFYYNHPQPLLNRESGGGREG